MLDHAQTYLQSFKAVLTPDWAVCIVTGAGEIASTETPPQHEAAVRQWLANLTPPGADEDPAAFNTGQENTRGYAMTCTTDTAPEQIYTVFISQTSDILPNTKELKSLIGLMREQMALLQELDDMAVELAERYEELNLVYATGDQLDMRASDEEIMQGIVENIVNYLEGQFALVTIPSRSITIENSPAHFDFSAFSRLLQMAEPDILSWLQENRQAAIFNGSEDLATHPLAADLPFRFIASPIFDSEETVIGALAMGRGFDQNKISNGDKNLLRAMAHKISQALQYSYDRVTSLPKHKKFESQLTREIENLQPGHTHTLWYVTMREISFLRERYGASETESILRELSGALRKQGRMGDIGGVLDNGHLVFLLPDCEVDVGFMKALLFAEKVSEEGVEVAGNRIPLGINIGVIGISSKSLDAEQIITQAGMANRIAARSADSSVELYSEDSESITRQKNATATLAKLQDAFSNGGFQLYAQSIKPLLNHDPSPHFEVLLRLFDKDNQMISPGDFIPVAEEHGFMPQIDRWVASQTLKQLHRSGVLVEYPETVCSINLSGDSLSSPSTIDEIKQIVIDSVVPAQNICFEVTETSAIQDLEGAGRMINLLRDLGCKFALDDFGAGLSSFTYLRSLSLDYVKIDGFFVKDLLTDKVAEKMVAAIHEVGSAMGLETVAEFVENQDIADRLTTMGIHFAQGYGIDKPNPLDGYLQAQLTRRTA